jgi:1,4-alpha-glucan branching enzyme
MLFMGEEWNAQQPFPFFCDFGPNLAEAVRKGRREEFARFPEFQSAEQREHIPDPQAYETFSSAKLCWDDRCKPGHREWLDWYRHILAVRHQSIVPLLTRIQSGGSAEVKDDGAVQVRWKAGKGADLVLSANLSSKPVGGFSVAPSVIWQEGQVNNEGSVLPPWTVVWSLDDRSGVSH